MNGQGYPLRLGFVICCVMAQDGAAVRQRRDKRFSYAESVSVYQGIRGAQDLRCGAVVFHHHYGFRAGVLLVKIQKILYVRAAPGIYGLVRIAYDEKVFVMIAQHLHEAVLQTVNVLEFIDHYILKPLLPFELYLFVLLENVEREFYQVVVIKPEALLLLIQVSVKDDVVRFARLHVLFMKRIKGHGYHVKIIFRAAEKLLYLDHIPRVGKSLVTERQPALFVYDLKHGVDIGVVEDEKALWVLHRIAVLLQNRHAKAVKGVDIACVVVACQIVYPLAHLICGLVGEGDAQNISREDTKLIYEVGKAMRKRPGLARACPRDNAHEALRSLHRLTL